MQWMKRDATVFYETTPVIDGQVPSGECVVVGGEKKLMKPIITLPSGPYTIDIVYC